MDSTKVNVDSIIDELAKRLSGDSGSELGFIEDGEVSTSGVPKVYVKDIGGGAYWYFYDTEQKAQIPIPEPNLVGTIVDLQSYTKTSEEYNDSEKLNIHVEADKKYIVESGLNSVFSRGILAALENANADSLKDPVRIKVGPGSKPNVVVSELFTKDGELILCNAYKHKDSAQLLAEAQANLGFTSRESSSDSGDDEDVFDAGPQRAQRPRRGLPT